MSSSVEEAIVGAYDECEQRVGLQAVIPEHVAVPFTTAVVRMSVWVERVAFNNAEEIAAKRRCGPHQGLISCGDLPSRFRPTVIEVGATDRHQAINKIEIDTRLKIRKGRYSDGLQVTRWYLGGQCDTLRQSDTNCKTPSLLIELQVSIRRHAPQRAQKEFMKFFNAERRLITACVWVAAFLGSNSNFAYGANGSSLAEAVKKQDHETVSILLKQKARVDVPLGDGSTALHWAVEWQDLGLVNTLVDARAPVNATDDYGVTPLWLAAVNGNRAIIDRLLRAGADPNISLPSGETVLMMAARTGNVDAVNALLERGAAVNAVTNETGQTALMWAAAEGHTDVVQTLLQRGADSQARSKRGYTAFLLAARNSGLEIPTLLLGAGANVADSAVDGTTALIIATIRSNVELAKFLIERGADINAGPGFTPLHWASGYFGDTRVNGRMGAKDEGSEWSRIEGLEGQAKIEFVKFLIAHGANVNARADVLPHADGSDMGLSVINATLGISSEAVKFGATPLWLAARVADVDTMRLLLQHGADTSIVTGRNVTPLMAAAGVGAGPGSTSIPEDKALEAVRICLEAGNDVNVANVDGESALHGAAYRTPQPADKLIHFLVQNGAKMNVKNKRGWTPLAIVEGLYFNGSYTLSKSAAALLLSLGAEPTPEGSVDRQVATLNVGVVNR